MPRAKITALGCFVPDPVLTNFDLESMVETSNDWIVSRTGIRERHIAPAGMATSDMAVAAARHAIEARGIAPDTVEVVIVCTVTPDMFFPSTACLVQDRIGAKGAWGFDLVAACSGFIYGLTTAAQLIAAGAHKRILVVGSDTMSRIVNYKDRSTCILFGDAAGAVLIEPAADGEDSGFLGFWNEIDGSGGDYLKMPAGGSRQPATCSTIEQNLHYVHQDGPQVFKYAVRKMYEASRDLLDRHGLSVEDIAILIPHQANRRIITAAAERLGIPCERVLINIDRYGNTTAATIPLALRDAIEQGRLKKGDLVMMAAVGAGFTVGANLWRWSY